MTLSVLLAVKKREIWQKWKKEMPFPFHISEGANQKT
jgi:hypothetical protein